MSMKRKDILIKANSVLGKTARHFGFKTDWCALFINWLFGDESPFNAAEKFSCTSQVAYWKKQKRCFTDFTNILTGDIVYYQGFDDIVGDYDHVGIVVKRDGEYITVLEGNTDGYYWDNTVVGLRNITIKYSCLGCYARPVYDDEKINTNDIIKTNYSIDDVKTYYKHVELIQIMLNTVDKSGIIVDGYYGNNTRNAVLNFQTKHNLEIDGISGNETITMLCKKYFNLL